MKRYIINYLFLVSCYNVLVFPVVLMAAIMAFPFFFIYISLKHGLPNATISFIDEIIYPLIIQIKYNMVTLMVCGGLILHKTYLNYIVKTLNLESLDYINFVELLEDLNADNN